jgi:UDP-N-acetyl-D-galactosamine dehydrogenase
LDIRTQDVLEAAGTKWNFLKFTPGLVGGHCIGVDPYYLTAKAESLGYRPEVILAGRRINDDMGAFVAEKTVELLKAQRGTHEDARVGVLGLTFKENVPDLRNSRVPDITTQLASHGLQAIVHDPLASAEEARAEYGIELRPFDAVNDLDALIVAVAHREYLDGVDRMFATVKDGGIVIDVKSVLDPATLPSSLRYWSL